MRATFPVFVLERDSGEVMRFDTIHQMQRQLERIDVENGEYRAWDADGRELVLKVQVPVWLVLEPRVQSDPDDLKKALVAAARDAGFDEPADCSEVSKLFDLVDGVRRAKGRQSRFSALRRIFRRW